MSNYLRGPYNKYNEEIQWIRTTDGCMNQCEYCYCPEDLQMYGIPNIVRNKVKIMDMNILMHDFLNMDFDKKLNNKKIYYEMICGFDYRFLSPLRAKKIYDLNFGKFNKHNKWTRGVRIAWDWGLNQEDRIKKAIDMFCEAGYKRKQIEIFMICDWKISAQECVEKLEKIYEWGCVVNDCWFDNTKSPNFQCNYWTLQECKNFRKLCRMANILTTFRHYEGALK